MRIKTDKEIMSSLIKTFSKKEDNVYYLGRLFMANSVIRWIFKESDSNEEILQYLLQVEKYLNGEIDLYWKNGTIKVGRAK